MQIHIVDDTHWVIKFEGNEKYDFFHLAAKIGRKPTSVLRDMIYYVVNLFKEKYHY